MAKVNPITLEMIRNRLVAIGREMVSTLVRTAGTPIYSEIKDFSCGLFDYGARQVVYGGLAVIHNLAIKNLVRTSLEIHGADPGVFDGDVFMGNDPYRGGGIHAPELGLASPIFVDGEVVAWSGSIAHQLDVGGMRPGGFCMDATDCFQEGIRLPPVKLFRKGELQRDIWNIHLNNVRLPEKIGMELKGQIAANHVAKKRVRELVAKVGLPTFKDACDALIDFSARTVEAKIRQLPEGVYEHIDFEEVEGFGEGLLPIRCDLSVSGGKLVFDFRRECPPQLPKFLNCTRTILEGIVYGQFMPLLCEDVPWNEGCTYPIEILSEPGTILDAQPPAPCSCPHVMFRAGDAALGALTKALVNSPLRGRLSACWDGSPPVIFGMAPGPGGRPLAVPMLEGMAGGGGAFSTKDGLDTASELAVMEYSMGDVETQENSYPILYLTRRFLTDSGGAGRYRGGVGALVAIVPHGADWLQFFLVEDRRQVPTHGAMGGCPGGSHYFYVGRGVDVGERIRSGFGPSDQGVADLELLPSVTVLQLGPKDLFAFTSNGGGGFGDPLRRDPQRVVRDVLWGFVSREQAERVYGVSLRPGSLAVDEAETGRLRAALRAERLAEAPSCAPEGGDYVTVDPRSLLRCGGCGAEIGSLAENWKTRVPRQDVRMDLTGMRVPADERVALRRYYCPSCGQVLDSEVTLRSLRPLWDFRPLAGAVREGGRDAGR
ncbi:MAG: hydantoinase B/oxoprolinase family protein [Deltaproteobacteria bacterium]|nr:hydantoinase B/oxoprolinase family protein [Deltaproteobacteria bacterium]